MIPSPVFYAEKRLGEKGIGWKEMMEARIGDHCMDHTDDGVDRDDWYERRVGMIEWTSGPPRLSPIIELLGMRDYEKSQDNK